MPDKPGGLVVSARAVVMLLAMPGRDVRQALLHLCASEGRGRVEAG
jgi:hypothetical protein